MKMVIVEAMRLRLDMIKSRWYVVEEKLWDAYLDSLDLERKKDFTEWGLGELFVLRWVIIKT